MKPIMPHEFKRAFVTHIVPEAAMTGYCQPAQVPQVGDLVAAEVLSLGKHATIENYNSITLHIFPGDRLIGAFGNRYATDQFEGYVPQAWREECDLLSVGGVCGEVCSAHSAMASPTRLRLLGAVCDAHGHPLNLHSFVATRPAARLVGEVILVVGSAMNAGKTTTVGTLARALKRAGMRVAAMKVTGTAAGKDCRFFASCGADPVLDFTSRGLPSTYMLKREDLITLYYDLLKQLAVSAPDYCIIEIADGIFQRETRLLLESEVVYQSVQHVFFAAGDSLAAECGVRRLRANGWPVRAVTGLVSASPLASREVEEEVGLPCLGIEQIMDGRLPDLLSTPQAFALGTPNLVHSEV